MQHSDRVHFIPNARLLVTLPLTNDRVELRRFDVEEAMEQAGIDYLVVTSDPPAFAQRGKPFRYPLTVKSKKGDVKVRVGDVQPEQEVGHVAIGTPIAGQPIERLVAGRLYE